MHVECTHDKHLMFIITIIIFWIYLKFNPGYVSTVFLVIGIRKKMWFHKKHCGKIIIPLHMGKFLFQSLFILLYYVYAGTEYINYCCTSVGQ